MKIFFVNFVIIAVLVLIGCQENQITDPVFNETTNKDQNQESYSENIISLKGMLNDPHPVGNSFFNINGQAQYKTALLNSNPMLPLSQRQYSVQLNVNADFRYFCSVCPPSEEDNLAGFIATNTDDLVPVTEHFYSEFEKSFKIDGREDGMVLKCKFFITTRTLELSAMWLALEDDQTKPQLINN